MVLQRVLKCVSISDTFVSCCDRGTRLFGFVSGVRETSLIPKEMMAILLGGMLLSLDNLTTMSLVVCPPMP